MYTILLSSSPHVARDHMLGEKQASSTKDAIHMGARDTKTHGYTFLEIGVRVPTPIKFWLSGRNHYIRINYYHFTNTMSITI